MSIPRRHSLAGTNGIPAESDRVYVVVDADGLDLYAWHKDVRKVDFSRVRPRRVHWPDGRYWDVEGVFSKREFGRAAFGNLCVRFDVGIKRRSRQLFWEDGKWFVRRKQDARARNDGC